MNLNKFILGVTIASVLTRSALELYLINKIYQVELENIKLRTQLEEAKA